ncbi:MFS transporter [Candidatus Saccharibacteria bacterium]|nr:MFS transporter [Candidatus Saccharibacteria bacterium]
MKNKHNTLEQSAIHNLRLVMAESSITAGLLAMSVLTPFFNSIGLNQTQISETQMAFTVITMLLNLPLGYLADRVSRKWANIIGDFGHALVMLIYSTVGSFWGAVACECIFGISSALTDGVDQSLLKHFIDKVAKNTGKSEPHLLKTKTAQLEAWRQACSLFLIMLGGPIGAIDLRLAIALSAVNHIIGGIISIFIKDDSPKLKPTHKNPLKDMASVIKTAFATPMLRRRIFAFAIAREMTHSIVWIATPLFLKTGVPISLVSFVWAGNTLMAILGAHLASKHGKRLSDPVLLAIPIGLMTISMIIVGLSPNIFTVWLYGIMGIIQGWTAATMPPMVQHYAKASEQTSVLSLAKMVAQLLYIPAVWIIGFVADIEINFGLLATVAIFLPLGLLSIKTLTKPA